MGRKFENNSDESFQLRNDVLLKQLWGGYIKIIKATLDLAMTITIGGHREYTKVNYSEKRDSKLLGIIQLNEKGVFWRNDEKRWKFCIGKVETCVGKLNICRKC